MASLRNIQQPILNPEDDQESTALRSLHPQVIRSPIMTEPWLPYTPQVEEGEISLRRVDPSEQDRLVDDGVRTSSSQDTLRPQVATSASVEASMLVHEKAAKNVEMSTNAKDSWRPRWLSSGVLASFSGLFFALTITLPVLLWLSERQHGIMKVQQRYEYVWRFGPSAAFTILSVLWARVEFQALKYMPWIALRHGLSVNHKLDYTSMIPPKLILELLRRRHYLALLAVIVSLLVKVEIALAPALLKFSPITTTEVVNIGVLDTFNVSYVAKEVSYDESSAYYAARAMKDFDMTYPFGVTKDFAYQTFHVRGTTSTPLRVEVDAILVDPQCLKMRDFSFLGMRRTTGSSAGQTSMVTARFEGCQRDILVEQRMGSLMKVGQLDDVWTLNDSLSINVTGRRPCPSLPRGTEQFVYFAGKYRMNSRNESEMSLESASAVLCAPGFRIAKVVVVDDGVNPNATISPGSSSVPLDIDFWKMVMNAVRRAEQGWTPLPGGTNYGPVSMESLLKKPTEPASNVTDLTDLLSHSVLNVSRRLGPFLAHYMLRQKHHNSTSGEITCVVDRLVINRPVCIAIFSISLVITLMIAFMGYRYGLRTLIWHRDPGTLLGSMLYLTSKERVGGQMIDFIPDDGKRKWSNCPYSPLTIRTWTQAIFTIFACSLVAGLTVALRYSQSHDGLVTITMDQERSLYLLWTSAPGLVMLGLTLYINSHDMASRSLFTIHSLSSRPRRSDFLDDSATDILGLRMLMKSLSHRSATLASSQITVFVCGILATLSAILYSVETAPIITQSHLRQTSWLGDRDIGENLTALKSNREILRSLFAQRAETNVTYPKNTFADLALPTFSHEGLPRDIASGNVTIRVTMPAARLTPVCKRQPESSFGLNITNYTESNGPDTYQNFYYFDFLSHGICPNGTTFEYKDRAQGFTIESNSVLPRYVFGRSLGSPQNLETISERCDLDLAPIVNNTGVILSPYLTQTYFWGAWKTETQDLDYVRFWQCNYTWWETMVDVNFVWLNGDLIVDASNPPQANDTDTKPFQPLFTVPHAPKQQFYDPLGTPFADIRNENASTGILSAEFVRVMVPYGKLPLEALTDPDREDELLKGLHYNIAFIGSQLANVENRLDMTQGSGTAPTPSEELPSILATVTDKRRRRLFQNPTITYVLIGILGFTSSIHLWILTSKVLRKFGFRNRFLSMDFDGVAPDGFGSLVMTAALLHDSNAMEHFPPHAQDLSKKELHYLLKDFTFRLGWFSRESDQTEHYTIGLMEDDNFGFLRGKDDAAVDSHEPLPSEDPSTER